MSGTQTRRKFLWKSTFASSGAAIAIGLKEQALAAQQSQMGAAAARA